MDISTFNNSEFGEIRTIQNDSRILFCGSDVARALGYARPADAISAHCKGVCVLPTPSAGGVQNTKFITEGDVYRLIAHSKLPGAERFERWVFDEVLPSIRKHGANGCFSASPSFMRRPSAVTRTKCSPSSSAASAVFSPFTQSFVKCRFFPLSASSIQ